LAPKDYATELLRPSCLRGPLAIFVWPRTGVNNGSKLHLSQNSEADCASQWNEINRQAMWATSAGIDDISFSLPLSAVLTHLFDSTDRITSRIRLIDTNERSTSNKLADITAFVGRGSGCYANLKSIRILSRMLYMLAKKLARGGLNQILIQLFWSPLSLPTRALTEVLSVETYTVRGQGRS